MSGGSAPRVSVLLPCRDAEGHLPDAIASLRDQTFADFEVLAIDDGSTDRTAEILRAWADGDDRVRVLSTAPRGLVPALTAGLEAARGELVARMDADDVALPERLERQVALMDDEPGVAACGTRVEYFPRHAVRAGARRYEAWINALVDPDAIDEEIFIECPIPHPTLVARREVLRGVGGYRDRGWPEDYDLVLRLWAAGHRLAKVPDVLLRWRERSDRASRTDPRYSPEAFRRVKIHFLRRTLLKARRAAVVWGAGPVGKTFARDLARQGTRIAAFVDIDPRKIGQEIHGAPVLAPAELPAALEGPGSPGSPGSRGPGPRRPLVLAAVGQPGARERIRDECRGLGLVEGADFVAIA